MAERRDERNDGRFARNLLVIVGVVAVIGLSNSGFFSAASNGMTDISGNVAYADALPKIAYTGPTDAPEVRPAPTSPVRQPQPTSPLRPSEDSTSCTGGDAGGYALQASCVTATGGRCIIDTHAPRKGLWKNDKDNDGTSGCADSDCRNIGGADIHCA